MRRIHFLLVTPHQRDDVLKLTCTFCRRRHASSPVFREDLGETFDATETVKAR